MMSILSSVKNPVTRPFTSPFTSPFKSPVRSNWLKRPRRRICLLAATILALGVMPFAAAQTSYESVAVLSSAPVYQQTQVETPQERCVEERVARTAHRSRNGQSATPVIISTIIGGALGNAVGSNKSNKRVGAVLGAVLGNSVGRDLSRRRDASSTTYYDTVERCDIVYVAHTEERLIGYDVVYEYQGQRYTVRTQESPGATLQLRINVQPVL